MLASIRAYQIVLAPFLGSNCRFHPSCSRFASEAIEVHGAVRGAALAARRIGRCHPFHPGGFDPVPAKTERVAIVNDTQPSALR